MMSLNSVFKTIQLVLLSLTFSAPVYAESFDEQLLDLQHRWAGIQYDQQDNKANRFEQLAEAAGRFAAQYPDRAEPLIWQGIILSTWAGAKGGLGALSLVKQAKTVLEKSIRIDPDALDGSAYTSLGSLYYQVPGWPIGFGDDDKAKVFLSKALQINPTGIDANYFYADYLMDEGKYQQARDYFLKALAAPARANRADADNGRRHEIQLKLATLDKHV